MNSPQGIDELARIIAQRVNHQATEKSVKRYLYALYVLMLEQLETNKVFKMPKFGIFKLETTQEKEMKVGDPQNGGIKYIYVPSEITVTFTPSKYLLRAVRSDFRPKLKKADKKYDKKYRKDLMSEYSMTHTVSELFSKNTKERKRNNNGKV